MSLLTEDRKNYVIDTSVLAFHGESIHNFPGCNIYIPIEVLEELDNLKTRTDQTGGACRYVNRYLDQARKLGSLSEGVEISGGQKIYVISGVKIDVLPSGLSDTVDNKLIALAYQLKLEGKLNVSVVSRDISLRIRCDSLSVSAIDYEKSSGANRADVEGLRVIEVLKDEIDQFYLDDALCLEHETFHPNEGIIIRAEKSSALAMAVDAHNLRRLEFAGDKSFSVQKIVPKSKEQTIACELLLDPEISMVSIIGQAGTGKTLLAAAAALEMIQAKKYKKLIISRPAQSMSKDLGYLPGSLQEKLAPWLQPLFDNFEVLLGDRGKSYLDLMMEKGTIEMEALSYIRGRTLPNTIFIIDEAQNITHHEAKAILTRMGENSKVILLGDLEQIDAPHLSQNSSGLTSVIELFKEFPGSGHIRLRKGERSALATFAAKVM